MGKKGGMLGSKYMASPRFLNMLCETISRQDWQNLILLWPRGLQNLRYIQFLYLSSYSSLVSRNFLSLSFSCWSGYETKYKSRQGHKERLKQLLTKFDHSSCISLTRWKLFSCSSKSRLYFFVNSSIYHHKKYCSSNVVSVNPLSHNSSSSSRNKYLLYHSRKTN